MREWPFHARFAGPIVMIGFGLINNALCRSSSATSTRPANRWS